jgi:stage II sporulation protein AA (anti-sigma F factor antagonist)
MEETTTPGGSPAGAGAQEPRVAHVMDGDTARLTLTGELTDAARRPLVRVLTDLLLSHQALQRVELVLTAVTFMNSAGMSVLVQAQRMTSPRGVDVVLVDPPAQVIRPLQLSGLWHRFPVLEAAPDERGDTGS